MKQTAIATLACLILFGILPAQVQAGSSKRHTIEGFMLGAGTVLLGTAIVHQINHDRHRYHGHYRYHGRYRDHGRYRKNDCDRPRYKHRRHARITSHYRDWSPPRHKYRKGRWEVRKVWVPPVFEKRWNPGHYTPRGRWVPGGYHRILVREGYWERQKVRGKRGYYRY